MPSRRSSTPDPSVSGAVESIVSELRERALAAEAGASIGSEEELRVEFGVSRPTMRQASRILQYEGILEVRRGVRGGYYASRPNLGLISRLAAAYLRSVQLPMESVDAVLDALNPLIIQSVIKNGKTQRLAEFAIAPKNPAALSVEEFRSTETKFSLLLMDLTGNFAILFIHAIFFQVGASIPRREPGSDARRVRAINLRVKLAKALMERDTEAAIRLSAQYRRLHTQGLDEDLRARAQKRTRRRS